jgi:CRP/FNR family cyclic AMP-dependent transcriptional regulator
MARTSESAGTQEDLSIHLPYKPGQKFPKGSIIPGGSLYFVIQGCVKVTSNMHEGEESIGRIVSNGGLFGESAIIDAPGRHESATALDDVTLTSWSRSDIEQHIERDPRLGVALAQYYARQCLELRDRIESMAVQKTPERIMLALVNLARGCGTPRPDGPTRMLSFTHQTLASYVGTSREIVTVQLNRLRKAGMIRYSRRYMDIDVKKIEAALSHIGH